MFKTILGIELTSDGYVIDDAYIIQLLTYGLTQSYFVLVLQTQPNRILLSRARTKLEIWKFIDSLGQPCYASNMPYPHKPFFQVTA